MNAQIDTLGLLKARNGETWRVVFIDDAHVEYPVVALDSKGIPNTFTKDGRILTGKESEFDLVSRAVEEAAPLPPVRIER